jgi:hypothetical protein
MNDSVRSDLDAPISYQTFGENFIRYLVTVPRLRAEIEDTLRATVEGSTAALPKDLLVADYQFQPDTLDIVHRDLGETEVGFTLSLSGRLDLSLRVMGMSVRAPMAVAINVDVDVRTYAPLCIRLEPQRVSSRNIDVRPQLPKELRSLPAQWLGRINPLAATVRESIVREVNAQLRRPELDELATIDVLALAERALAPAR